MSHTHLHASVRVVAWINMPQSEKNYMHDTIVEAFELDDQVDDNTIKMVYYRLSNDVVYKGLMYGFGDTEVREEMYAEVYKMEPKQIKTV